MKKNPTVAVIGGGNGAFAAAVHMTLKGLKVNLCDPYHDGESIRPLLKDGKISYLGVLGQGSLAPNLITPRIEEAAVDADLFLVSVPATAHATAARWLASVLPPHATVLLNPGHTGGALHFRQSLQKAGFVGQLTLGETNTLTYIARKQDPTTINITNVAKHIHVAALPAIRLGALMDKTQMCYPDLQPTKTVLGTSLRNVNAIMHTPAMILAAAWIEHTAGDFYFYHDAATPAVGGLMKAIDDERLAIAAAWNEPVEPLIDLLARIGTTTVKAQKTGSLQQAFLDSKPNRWIKAPPSLDHRYMHEDIGHGLVAMAVLGQIVSTETPVMQSVIRIASTITEIDYWTEGQTLESMGLSGLTSEEILAFLEKGS